MKGTIKLHELRAALDMPASAILFMAGLSIPSTTFHHRLCAYVDTLRTPFPPPIQTHPYEWSRDALIEWRRALAYPREEERTQGERYFYRRTYNPRWRNIVENPFTVQRRTAILQGLGATHPTHTPPKRLDP